MYPGSAASICCAPYLPDQIMEGAQGDGMLEISTMEKPIYPLRNYIPTSHLEFVAVMPLPGIPMAIRRHRAHFPLNLYTIWGLGRLSIL
jgi:hypothetical protein